MVIGDYKLQTEPGGFLRFLKTGDAAIHGDNDLRAVLREFLQCLDAEPIAVFEAMRPLDPARVVLGQYDGYLDEDGVAADSTTETLVAAEVFVDTDRWRGVPFLLRTGKCLAATRRTVTLRFRATDTDSLREIYAEIDRSEKTTFEAPQFYDYRELYPWLLLPALGLLLAEVGLGETALRKLP